MFLPIGDEPNPHHVPVMTIALIAVNVAVYLLITLPLGDARFFGHDGKPVDRKAAVRELLRREETPVLVPPDGKPVDPFYLKPVKEGTLIVVVPAEKLFPPAAPPPVPLPSAPLVPPTAPADPPPPQ